MNIFGLDPYFLLEGKTEASMDLIYLELFAIFHAEYMASGVFSNRIVKLLFFSKSEFIGPVID